MELQIEKKLLSFRDIPTLADRSEKSVLLLRHSMRVSLNHGTDPVLTPEGTAFARQCGTLLAGLSEAGFGASPRKRAILTAEALKQEIDPAAGETAVFPEISDTAMFVRPDMLDAALRNSNITDLLREYYTMGHTEGLIDRRDFASELLQFLTSTDFKSRNTILITHDILIVCLLTHLKVYPFEFNDWCGYVQGAALFRSADGVWSVRYAVPDAANRPKTALFV
jgi:broad specificity phosphatase PhoE